MTNNVQCDTLSGDRLVSFPKCCQNLKLLSSGTKRSLFTYIQNVKRFKRGRYGNQSLKSGKGWMWMCFNNPVDFKTFSQNLAIRFLWVIPSLLFHKLQEVNEITQCNKPSFLTTSLSYLGFSLPSINCKLRRRGRTRWKNKKNLNCSGKLGFVRTK